MRGELIRLEHARHRYQHRILPDVEREYADLFAPPPRIEGLDSTVEWPEPQRPGPVRTLGLVLAALGGALLLRILTWRSR